MKKKICIKKSIYIFIFILFICYGCSLSIYIILYFRDFNDYNLDKNESDNKLIFIGKTFIVTNIIVISLIIISTTLFACYFNCFLSQEILVFYIISLIIMIIFELPSLFILLENILNNKQNLNIKIIIIFILNIVEILCGFASIITNLLLRNILIKEIELSPLNFVNLDMTEKVYYNILKKSGNYKRPINKKTINNKKEQHNINNTRIIYKTR